MKELFPSRSASVTDRSRIRSLAGFIALAACGLVLVAPLMAVSGQMHLDLEHVTQHADGVAAPHHAHHDHTLAAHPADPAKHSTATLADLLHALIHQAQCGAAVPGPVGAPPLAPEAMPRLYQSPPRLLSATVEDIHAEHYRPPITG